MGAIRHNELNLSLPAGWEDATQVVALGPADGDFRPSLVLSQEPARGESAEKFAARQLPLLKQALTGFALAKEGPATFGKHGGFLREHSFSAGAKKIGQLQFYVVAGAIGYTVTFSHLANRVAGTRKVAEQAFGELQIG